jgi:enamine deaminase RidA (YjgF/YER057c/UK114 family)
MSEIKYFTNVEGVGDGAPVGYSHAVSVGDLIFVAGELGVEPGGDNSFEAQAVRVLDKVVKSAEAAGGGKETIVQLTVYLTDIANGRPFGALRKEYFGSNFPTSAAVAISGLVFPEALIEISATAVKRA